MFTLSIVVIITVSILFICLLLLSVASKQKQKKMNQLFKQFSKLGTAHNLSFSSHEIINHFIIGLDGINRKLLILTELDKPPAKEIIIDLDEVKNCTVKKYYGNIRPGDLVKRNLDVYLERVSLHFEFNNEKDPLAVPFFDHTRNEIYHLKYLEEKAEHWKQMLSQVLKTPAER